ncbi:MAG: hypothetical protein RLO52_39135 [Sandaracinaceae bacterium]|nr:MAG: hypothetical protein EVA89_09710 [Sandaracinaceae bacterium]
MRAPVLGGACLLFLLAGCGGGVDSDAAARAAYLGLDDMVEEAMNLGFDGFNAATSANIPEQSAMGDESGTLVVTGQVDQGSSPNKEMRLRAALTDYQDVVLVEDELVIVYDSVDAPLELDLSLRGVPDGTLQGTLTGALEMTGDITGSVVLDLTIEGDIEPDPMDEARVRRVPGTTTIRGTATSPYGVFEVDVVR